MKPLGPIRQSPDDLEREISMPSLPNQSRFEDRDCERATLFLADRLGGGGLCPSSDNSEFHAAWRLDRSAVRVLAVKRTMPDFRARLLRAAQREQISFVLVRLARLPEISGLTFVDIVVHAHDEFQLLTDLSIVVSSAGEMSFVPAASDGAGVWWTTNSLRVGWAALDTEERTDSLCRAARLMIHALRQPSR